MSYNIGFIGGGNMSIAIATGILKSGIHPASNMWVSGPHLSSLTHWAQLGAHTTVENGKIFSNCQIIFLGVKPAMFTVAVNDIIKTLPPNFVCRNILLVSMLAGIPIHQLHKTLNNIAGGTGLHVIRIMPNMPMSVGAGTCLYTPDSRTTIDECKMIETLLSSCGFCEKVSEDLMNASGVLTGCGPAFMYMMIEALADGVVKQGVSRAMALRLAAQVLIGSGEMVLKTKKHPGLLKDEVCSPGGSTICGVAALEKGGLRATLIDAIEAALHRTLQLEQQ